MSLATPAQVVSTGSLVKELFGLTLDADLTTLLQGYLDDAEAWMVVYLGSNFGGANAAEARIQTKAEVLLAVSYATATLRARRVYGTFYPLQSEDSPEYEDLLEKDWEGMARTLLAKWLQLEIGVGATGAKSFALPYFAATDSPVCPGDEDVQMRRLADEARARPEQFPGTVVA